MRKIIIASILFAFILLATFFAGCSEDQDPIEKTDFKLSPPAENIRNKPLFAKDTILVKFKPSIPQREISALNSVLGASFKDFIPGIDVTVLNVPAGQAELLVKRFNQNRRLVEYAELNGIAYATYVPNDPYLSEQWGLSKINASSGWDITKGSTNVAIAILDTGIDDDHEDLSAKVVRSRNFTDSPNNDDIYGHGTHCAGIASAITDNAIGVAGLGFNCSLMDYKVLSDDGWGYYDWIAKGVIYAATDGAKVISMSLCGYYPSLTMKNAVAYAWRRGAVLTAAAGNDCATYAAYPAYYNECIAVGASDQDDNRAYFSNYGKWVDVAAPGVDIFSTLPNHTHYLDEWYGLGKNYGYLSGTSMSTPFVAGLAGLIWATNYGTNNALVRNRIESTCVYVGDWVAHGRINASAAVGATLLAPVLTLK